MRSAVAVLGLITVLVGACVGRPAPAAPVGTPSPAPVAAVSPSTSPSIAPAASLDASKVPPGLIAYMRVDPGKVERFFTVAEPRRSVLDELPYQLYAAKVVATGSPPPGATASGATSRLLKSTPAKPLT